VLLENLNNHPGCTSCDRCGGDGFVHISDRLDTGFGNYGPADEDIGNYILTGDAGAGASLRDNAVNGALAMLPAVTKWGYNKLSRHCPVCNPNGSKDSADSNVKSCTYCAGDGLVHKHDNGCPNCVCTTSGKRREECDEWHVLGAGYCKTTPCSKCAAKAAPAPKPCRNSSEGSDLIERLVRLEGISSSQISGSYGFPAYRYSPPAMQRVRPQRSYNGSPWVAAPRSPGGRQRFRGVRSAYRG